jgi:hypothetical protein
MVGQIEAGERSGLLTCRVWNCRIVPVNSAKTDRVLAGATRASCPALNAGARAPRRLDRPARARHPGGVPENKPETPHAVSVRTLAHLGPRNRLDAHCASCRRSQRLDVEALISRYGPLPLDLLRERLVCGRCGARRPELIMSWDISLAGPIFRSP